MDTYNQFLQSESRAFKPAGFDADDGIYGGMASAMFTFQRDIVTWACKLGKAAIFADCGLGKTLMQLAWARQVHAHTGGAY